MARCLTAREAMSHALLAVVCFIAIQGLPALTFAQDAAPPSNRSQEAKLVSVQQAAASAPVNIIQNIKTMIEGMVEYQSGHKVTSIDLDGTSEWYRRYFRDPPLKLDTSLQPPSVPLSKQTASNKTVSRFFCPYRDFRYKCRLDKQSFKQHVSSTSSTRGWNIGLSSKLTAIVGFEFLGTGNMAGPTISFSFSYASETGTASATTDRETTVQTVIIDMQPSNKKCVLITTTMRKVEAEGTQLAYLDATGSIGTHQHPAQNWKLDGNTIKKHYYRKLPVALAIQLAKEGRVMEAADWKVQGAKASLVATIKHKFDVATEGRTFNTWFDAASADCTKWDSGPAKLQSSQSGQLPIIDALRVPV